MLDPAEDVRIGSIHTESNNSNFLNVMFMERTRQLEWNPDPTEERVLLSTSVGVGFHPLDGWSCLSGAEQAAAAATASYIAPLICFRDPSVILTMSRQIQSLACTKAANVCLNWSHMSSLYSCQMVAFMSSLCWHWTDVISRWKDISISDYLLRQASTDLVETTKEVCLSQYILSINQRYLPFLLKVWFTRYAWSVTLLRVMITFNILIWLVLKHLYLVSKSARILGFCETSFVSVTKNLQLCKD